MQITGNYKRYEQIPIRRSQKLQICMLIFPAAFSRKIELSTQETQHNLIKDAFERKKYNSQGTDYYKHFVV